MEKTTITFERNELVFIINILSSQQYRMNDSIVLASLMKKFESFVKEEQKRQEAEKAKNSVSTGGAN